jgi:hypothetical protein
MKTREEIKRYLKELHESTDNFKPPVGDILPRISTLWWVLED